MNYIVCVVNWTKKHHRDYFDKYYPETSGEQLKDYIKYGGYVDAIPAYSESVKNALQETIDDYLSGWSITTKEQMKEAEKFTKGDIVLIYEGISDSKSHIKYTAIYDKIEDYRKETEKLANFEKCSLKKYKKPLYFTEFRHLYGSFQFWFRHFSLSHKKYEKIEKIHNLLLNNNE